MHNCRWCTSDAQASGKVVGKHVALYSVPRVPKQYPSSIQAVPRLVAQDLHKEWPSSTSVVYKECPSSSSSVQEVAKQVALVYKSCPSLYTCCAQIGHWLGHVYISKQFPSLGTLSVTAWTQLVHICEQVSFQVGHSNFYSSDHHHSMINLEVY